MKKEEDNNFFLNPTKEGVSLADFLIELEKTKLSIKDYCKNKLNEEQINLIENEIKIYKNLKK